MVFIFPAVCNDTLGVEVGFVPDDWITVSSHYFESGAGRSRLNMETLPCKRKVIDDISGKEEEL